MLLALSLASSLAWWSAASPADGKSLYKEHCAACHGPDGGGDGPLAKDLRFKPRAFKEGKFAFGNTTEAMTKTMLSGIPGEDAARMPPFKGILNDAEIAAVIDYVRTLMPAQPVLTAADMKMEVSDTPKIVRGVMAPLREGERPLARALLAGLPSGFSFEYATENFHLVAVRRGEFLTRTDWLERGGKPLTPLGTPLFVAPEPKEWIAFAVAPPPADASKLELATFGMTTAKLRETSTRGGQIELKADLIDATGKLRAHVIERPRDIVVAGAAGIVQEFELIATDTPVAVLCSIALASDPKLPLPVAGNQVTELTNHLPGSMVHSAARTALQSSTGLYVVRAPDGSLACVRLEVPEDAIWQCDGRDSHEVVDVQVVVGDEPVIVRRTTVFCANTTVLGLKVIAHELGIQ